MKKLFATIATVVLCCACALGIAGCTKNADKLKVFVPDGAPALALAGISRTEADKYFDISVVNASTINSYVSGNEEADIAVMPVNAAVKLLGDGENYKMLGTVTHGNLFLLKKQSEEDITAENISSLVGKTVGVINLENVPGLTFKTVLANHNLQFKVLKDVAETVSDKVNLKSVTAQEAAPTNASCSYFVVFEPAATTKVTAAGGKLAFAGSLQTLYGGENGYPQAVAVAKTSVINSNKKAISAFIQSFEFTQSWLADENTTSQAIVQAVDNMTKGDLSHMFTAENLTKPVIANCGIKFEANATGKAQVLAFMDKLNAVSDDPWGTPSDKFFY